MTPNIKYIDIKKIIEQSNSRLLKSLPNFIVKIIIKVVGQNEMNRILNKYSGDIGIAFLPKVIEEFNLTLEIEGIENLPQDGKCFFVANHPFGIIDGLVLTYIVSQKYGSVKAIANEGFLMIPQLRPLVAAVNVFEHSPREYLMALEELYKSEIPITHFPSGEVSRKYFGEVQDAAWQKSFISKAILNQRNIVPLCFCGKNSKLFYFVYIARRFLRISANLELALLPYEMFKKRNKTITVKIGKAISYQSLDKSISNLQWAQIIRSTVYKLKQNKE